MIAHRRLALRRYYGVILLLLFCGLSLPFFMSSTGRGPTIVDGVADFAGTFASERPVELAGAARFAWRSAASPAELAMRVPGQWAGIRTPGGVGRSSRPALEHR